MLDKLLTALGPLAPIAQQAGSKLGDLINDVIDQVLPKDNKPADDTKKLDSK